MERSSPCVARPSLVKCAVGVRGHHASTNRVPPSRYSRPSVELDREALEVGTGYHLLTIINVHPA